MSRLCLLGTFVLSQVPLCLSAAIVAYYPFEESLENTQGSGYAMEGVDGTDNSGHPTTSWTPDAADYGEDTVFGQTASYLSVTDHQGLNVGVDLSDRSVYTVVMDVRSAQVSAWNKLLSLDEPNSSDDQGVYFYSNAIQFYPVGLGDETISADQWVRVALSYDGSSMNLYYGDDQDFWLAASDTSHPYYTLGETTQFLKDDSVTGYGENDPVDIAALWINDSAMSFDELDPKDNPDPPEIPEPSAGTLLCALIAISTIRRTAPKPS